MFGSAFQTMRPVRNVIRVLARLGLKCHRYPPFLVGGFKRLFSVISVPISSPNRNLDDGKSWKTRIKSAPTPTDPSKFNR
jgi:hypothetical protein